MGPAASTVFSAGCPAKRFGVGLSGLPELTRDEPVKKICKQFKWRAPSVRGAITQQAVEAADEPADLGCGEANR